MTASMALTRSVFVEGLQQEFGSFAFHCFHCSRNVTMPVRKMIGGPTLFAKRVCNSKPVMSGSWRSRMRDMCLNLDRLDGILIEMVVEEREPGIAVVVVAIDLDRGTILAHSAAFTYVAQTKILAGNNCHR